ncbi:MAG TPA: hypothetical protein VGP35_08690 [Terriglobales bacterium]|jgi:hypothetical protein|nr:hypothetical protein [Terriglobales bacterium]
MRISCLLVILLWAMVSVCEASDSARPSSASATANSSADRFNPSTIAGNDLISLPSTDRPDREYRGFDPARSGDVFCLKMHIFEMKRESPRSDVFEPDGQSTCQAASKYSMKVVGEPAKAPSR